MAQGITLNPTKTQANGLNNQIKQNQNKVTELQIIINRYKTQINKQESQKISLKNEVAILDNRVAQKQLDIERVKAQLEVTRLEIISLETQITHQSTRIASQKTNAGALIRSIHRNDNISMLEVLLANPTLSTFFDKLEQDQRVEGQLHDVMQKVKGSKERLEDIKKQRDNKRIALENDKKHLIQEELALEAERNFKMSLIAETKNSQTEFERLLYELKQQQQSTSDDIANLESHLKGRLAIADATLARGDTLLNWPVDPSHGITAKFHDPAYPFNYLFPHSGVDIRVPVGTPVKAAAGGYVAWNRHGRMYGNYTMIIHPGNIATVYAHLSKFMAKSNTYIDRGTIIGLSGGMPGQPGAGLSTGPHLHFEVREDGIPVDPMNYLPSIAGYYAPTPITANIIQTN